jgi:hypothetical protein
MSWSPFPLLISLTYFHEVRSVNEIQLVDFFAALFAFSDRPSQTPSSNENKLGSNRVSFKFSPAFARMLPQPPGTFRFAPFLRFLSRPSANLLSIYFMASRPSSTFSSLPIRPTCAIDVIHPDGSFKKLGRLIRRFPSIACHSDGPGNAQKGDSECHLGSYQRYTEPIQNV